MANKQVPAVEVKDHDVFEAGGPGTVQMTVGGDGHPGMLLIKCPGCGEASALPLHGRTDKHDPGWDLKNRSPLTLHPSIHHDVKSCGWHGFLRNGVFS